MTAEADHVSPGDVGAAAARTDGASRRLAHDPYLEPVCRPSTLDSFGNRRLILAALKRELAPFTGLVLDVGCGEKPYRSLLLSPPSRASAYAGVDLPGNPYSTPDLEWDGVTLPKPDGSVDSLLLTEVLEHCAEPAAVLKEARRLFCEARRSSISYSASDWANFTPGGGFQGARRIPIHAVRARSSPASYCWKSAGFLAAVGDDRRDASTLTLFHTMLIMLVAVGAPDANLLGGRARDRRRLYRPVRPRGGRSGGVLDDLAVERFDESTLIVGLSAAAVKPECRGRTMTWHARRLHRPDRHRQRDLRAQAHRRHRARRYSRRRPTLQTAGGGPLGCRLSCAQPRRNGQDVVRAFGAPSRPIMARAARQRSGELPAQA